MSQRSVPGRYQKTHMARHIPLLLPRAKADLSVSYPRLPADKILKEFVSIADLY